MAFGQQAQQGAEEEKPDRMVWNGKKERAYELRDWGRDAALLPIVSVTPPQRDAAEGEAGAEWQVRALIAVPANLGGGAMWADVPRGATIRNTNTGSNAWTEPALTVVMPRGTAAAASNGEGS